MATRSFKDARVLVVGGAGFVGSNLVVDLLAADAGQVIVVDNLLSSDVANLPKDARVDFRQGSITEDATLERLPDDLDFVFHLACYHGNQSSIANPLADHENNTLTTLKLFERLKGFSRLTKVVYAAAGCAVAEKTFDQAVATTEDAPVSLYHDSPYSISKLIGELYANYYWAHHELPVVKTRFQNVFGPREILGAGEWRGTPHTVWRNVVPTFIWKALHEEPLPLDGGGLASRDFIYVDDLVCGLMAAALRGAPGEVYNLASGVETTIRDVADMINDLTGNPTRVEIRPARDWDRSGRRFGSTEKSSRDLGFDATTSVRDGLQRTVAWMEAHRDTVERCIRQHDTHMARL